MNSEILGYEGISIGFIFPPPSSESLTEVTSKSLNAKNPSQNLKLSFDLLQGRESQP